MDFTSLKERNDRCGDEMMNTHRAENSTDEHESQKKLNAEQEDNT